MVKKFVMEINDDAFNDPNEYKIDELMNMNNDLQEKLTKYKNKISEYYKNKLWDRYKKISNEYEMIFTTPNNGTNVSQYLPVSRSFFKMWEILYDFESELRVKDKTGLKCLFLAEGPGGFAEALIKYRYMHSPTEQKNDQYHGMTLRSNNNKNIPEWKLGNDILKQVKVHYGADDTGNLYNMSNIVHLSNEIGKNSMDLITADGGFDFSSDFNNQEEMSIQLIYCEILTALLTQKLGGSFILKIYDIFNETTIKMIHLLKKFYKTIYIIKPLTSRPANSEKYILCIDFFKSADSKKYLEILYKKVIFQNDKEDAFKRVELEYDIFKKIVLYNSYSIMRQIFYIQNTIDYINFFRKSLDSKNIMNRILGEHMRKSKKWCEKYEIYNL